MAAAMPPRTQPVCGRASLQAQPQLARSSGRRSRAALLAAAVALAAAPVGAQRPATNLHMVGPRVALYERTEAGSELATRLRRVQSALELEQRGANATAFNATAQLLLRGGALRPVPKLADAAYSESTCDRLFAYADARTLCRKMQRKICGKSCERLVKNEEEQCRSLQDTLCHVPTFGPTPAPVAVGEVPHGQKPVNVTICNGRPAERSAVYVALEGEAGPRAVVPELGYLDCAQISAWSGLVLGIYSGAYAPALHTCDAENSIVMFGPSGIDDTENFVMDFSFKDEGYKRPILCNAAYAERTLRVQVEGRRWYPFAIRGSAAREDPDGKIAYLECEQLALDHIDSIQRQESLQLWSGRRHLGDVPISPVMTLFLLGNEGPMGKEVLTHRSFNLGHLVH